MQGLPKEHVGCAVSMQCQNSRIPPPCVRAQRVSVSAARHWRSGNLGLQVAAGSKAGGTIAGKKAPTTWTGVAKRWGDRQGGGLC